MADMHSDMRISRLLESELIKYLCSTRLIRKSRRGASANRDATSSKVVGVRVVLYAPRNAAGFMGWHAEGALICK